MPYLCGFQSFAINYDVLYKKGDKKLPTNPKEKPDQENEKIISVIIDTDAACEADDPFAIAHALMSPILITV